MCAYLVWGRSFEGLWLEIFHLHNGYYQFKILCGGLVYTHWLLNQWLSQGRKT